MKYYFILLIVIFVFGCKTEELCNSRLDGYPSLATGYHYFFGPDTANYNYQLEYNSKGQIIKRVGGIYNDHYRGIMYFSKYVFDTIIYTPDTLRILNLYGEPGDPVSRRKLLFKTDIALLKNGCFNVKYRSDRVEEHFSYNEKNQISNKITSYRDEFPENDITFNTTYSYSDDANLATIKSIIYNNNSIDSAKSVFSNYDKAPNPFKQLQMFDDTFIRSLSANNYKQENNMTWEFYYDACGNIKFKK